MKLKGILYFCFTLWHTLMYAQCANEQFYTIGGDNGITTKIIEDIRAQNTYTFWGATIDTVSTEISSNRVIWILKNDSCGKRVWKKSIGYETYSDDNFVDVVFTPDSNLLVLGYGFYTGQGGIYSGTLFKIDPSGNIIWKRAYGGQNGLVPMSIAYNPYRNTYIISGRIERIHPSGLWNRAYVFEVDTAGNLLQEKDIFLNGDSLQADSHTLSIPKIVVKKDSTYFAVLDYWGNEQLVLLRLDTNLETITSTKPFENDFSQEGLGHVEFNDEKQELAFNIGGSDKFELNVGGWLATLDSLGVIKDLKFIDDKKFLVGRGMGLTNDGGYLLTGSGLMKYDSSLEQQWTKSFNIPEPYVHYVYNIIQLKNGAYAGVGLTSAHSKNAYFEVFTMQTGVDGRFVGIETQNKETTAISIYPNPSAGIYTLAGYESKEAILNVFNQHGQQILHQSFSNTSFDLQSQPEGIYYLRLTDANGKLVHQQALLKTK